MQNLELLHGDAIERIGKAASLAELEAIRVAVLGKKGTLTEALKTLGSLDPETRKQRGQEVNSVKSAITEALENRQVILAEKEIEERLTRERIDITLPPRSETQGKIHPVSQVTEEMIAIFADLGFSVAEGPEIEDDYHNFTALNIPESHPARQMHDTFYLNGRMADGSHAVLRTHTSPVQVRAMQSGKPPFRFIAPGPTYRSDSDQTHTPMFHQIEALVIDRGIHMGHLKGCVEAFVKAFFESGDVPVRFRPSFFPFTEPSAEVDIGCTRSKESLKVGKGPDWLEIGGCGMVHPKVLKNCGLDPDEWQGFAFGWGIDRLAMLKYGVPDLRAFFESDARWLEHYGFDALDIPSLIGGLSR